MPSSVPYLPLADIDYTDAGSWQTRNALPPQLMIDRAQTQEGVNATVLNYLAQRFIKEAPVVALDLPCGNLEFAGYMKELFPNGDITAIDILPKPAKKGIRVLQMDIGNPLELPLGEQYDLITSVSGVMMFSNTKLFVENCVSRLKKGGTFILTNDNSATLKDRLTFTLFGKLRMFPPVFSDTEYVTENVPVQELIRLMRTQGLEIKDIVYTSTNRRDYLLYPLSWIIYPLQRRYLRRFGQDLPPVLIRKMYPFRQLFGRHYIIIAEKK